MHLSPSHLDTGKASILNLGAGQIRLAQIPTLQIDVLKIDLPAIGPPQVREEEIGDLAQLVLDSSRQWCISVGGSCGSLLQSAPRYPRIQWTYTDGYGLLGK